MYWTATVERPTLFVVHSIPVSQPRPCLPIKAPGAASLREPEGPVRFLKDRIQRFPASLAIFCKSRERLAVVACDSAPPAYPQTAIHGPQQRETIVVH